MKKALHFSVIMVYLRKIIYGGQTMNYKNGFTRAMDRAGIKYTVLDDFRVKVAYSGDNTNDITIMVIFDKDGDGLVALRCWSFGKCPNGKRAAVLEACNQLNSEYRWVKFYVDSDTDVSCGLDAVIDIDTVGEECIQLVRRMVSIYDDAYPVLMKACWH